MKSLLHCYTQPATAGDNRGRVSFPPAFRLTIYLDHEAYGRVARSTSVKFPDVLWTRQARRTLGYTQATVSYWRSELLQLELRQACHKPACYNSPSAPQTTLGFDPSTVATMP